MGATSSEWTGYFAHDFVFAAYEPGARVLDVGFGRGEQLIGLRRRGCRAVGIDYDPALVARARNAQLPVCRARAEDLPFPDASLDGVLCKVVIPYTDEARAVTEIARVLRPGGVARVAYHGLGYFLKYAMTQCSWRRCAYTTRVIVNTWTYRMTQRRLPGYWGDTLYQSRRVLRRYYGRAGLQLVEAPTSRTFLGAPVFIYHVLERLPLPQTAVPPAHPAAPSSAACTRSRRGERGAA